MDDLNLKQYEKLGPFEIKDFLAEGGIEGRAGILASRI